MDMSSGGNGASEPCHPETVPVPEPAMMDVVLSTEGVQAVVEVPGCHNCTVLQKELEDCKRDRAFFVDIKRKMILTDTLIQKHQSKCQAYEEQQKSIQNLTARLAQSKRDCKVLEEQLATTLKDIIPWKKDKERFLQESQKSEKQFEELHNKLKAQESLIRQYESKLEVCDEEKAGLESDVLMLKSKVDSMKQSSKKASASFEKVKDDNGKLRKEMSQIRKSRAALNMKLERAQTKIKELCNLLLRHGIKAPRMRGFMSTSDKEEEEEFMDETDSSDQGEEGDSKETSDTKQTTLKSQAKPVTVPTYHPHQSGAQSPSHSAAQKRRPFPKMDFTSVACLSPLPPSPPGNQEDKSNSSDGNESDTTLAEAAAKIEAQLSTPVLLRQRTKQLDKRQSEVVSTRVSPRRQVSRRSHVKGSDATDDPESSADGAASRRGLRSLRKLTENSAGSRKPPTRSSFRASKKLELENTSEGVSDKKRPQGQPKKDNDVSKDTLANLENDCREDLSHRLVGKVQTLSSSDEEVERKEDTKGKNMSEQSEVMAMRTRSKSKGLASSGQSVSSLEDSKGSSLGDDLALSSDEESKHSLYNAGDSDGSEASSIIGKKKRLNLKRQNLRKASALSDSSESEDESQNVKGKDPIQGMAEPSAGTHQSLKKPEALASKSATGKVLSVESSKSHKLTSGSVTDSLSSAKRTSKRLAHRQKAGKRQASIEEQNCSQEHDKDLKEIGKSKAMKTEDSKDADKIQRKVDRGGSERVSDSDEQSENSQVVLPEKRVTRQVSRQLLRCLSGPPVTRRSRIRTQDDESGGAGASQFQRKPGRGLSKDEGLISKRSSNVGNMSSKVRSGDSKGETSSQDRTLLRNLSSPARMTRSASRNLDASDSHITLAEESSSEQKDLSSNNADHKLNSQGEQSLKHLKGDANQKRRLSQKRTHSDSQSSEDEEVVENSNLMDTEVMESGKDTELSSKLGDDVLDDDENQSVRNDGKVLMRSETEEFVACMDDMPGLDGGEISESRKQTSENVTAEKGKTIPGVINDAKKRKLPTRQSKRIKLSPADTIQEKEESLSCMEGVISDGGGESSTVDADGESRNNKHLDRPSTSRGLGLSIDVASEEEVIAQPQILIAQQRDRHESSASLPFSERNSPVSPLQEPFQGFAYTRPISPMSPERPVERESPILPTFFFDLPAIPRMLSPLPPSPPRLRQEEATDDVREGDMQEVMSGEIAEAQAQPRMISPLFPTPVPFAVSPIPEMPVPPAISPIPDVQHPPEISPIADVQPPVLGIQTIQTVSPGKSPQLPSPRIFHSVAPSDAITVRPQHSSPGYNQDKPTAIRSLSAVLDRDDNRGDHRSSFSKKIIARRSSAEELGRKPGDTSQNNPPSHSELRTGPQATSSVNIVSNSALRTCADPEPTKQPHTSNPEEKASDSVVSESQNMTLHQSNTNTVEELQGKEDSVQPPLLNTKSGFSEYLRRADGHEEATAFSRVIPHRDEKGPFSSEASCEPPTKNETTGNTKNAPSDERKRSMTDTEVKNRDELNRRRMISNAAEAVVPDKSLSKLPSTTTVGKIWGQMAFHDRGERGRWSRKKQPKLPLVNSESKESENVANPQFKVPTEPPIPATHVLAQHSVQTSGKDQVPRTRGQVFPGFVPASRSKPLVSTPPQEASHSPALSATQQGPGSLGQVQDLDKTAHPTDQAETLNSKAIPKQGQTGSQDVDSTKAQARTSFIRPNQTKHLSSPVTPDQIKSLKKLHLHDVLRLIREHSRKESVFPVAEFIIEFLEKNSVNLFPAIYAKCIVGNTSTQPVISPHEEQISKALILWTREMNRKNVMHFVLSELGRKVAGQEGIDLGQTLTFCRLFAAICRETEWMVRARVMCYDIIRESLPNGCHLLLAMAAVWPSILRKKDGGIRPLMSTVEILVMRQLQADMKNTNSFKKETAEKITKCFAHLCNWNPMASESKEDAHAQWLIGLLKDPKIARFQQNKKNLCLGEKCFETIKAIELLASSQGWEWTNNKLIIEQLWPVLKDWSKSLTKGTTEKKEDGTPGDGSLAGEQQASTSLASACAVMKVIGNVGQIGLAVNGQSVEQLMKMLIAVLQQPSQSIPWEMQLHIAQSIYELSPSNQDVASQVLRQWVTKAVNAVPEKLAERINNLGRKLESPDEVSQPGVVSDDIVRPDVEDHANEEKN